MTAKARVKRYVSSKPDSGGKTVSEKERVKQKAEEINSPQNSEDYMLGKSMLDRLSMGEATPELTKQIGETVIRRDAAIEKSKQKEDPNFLGFLAEKAASGALESTEGTLNAWSRIGQMLEGQRLQQSLESQMAAARLFGDKELADSLVQQTVEQAKINTGRDKGLIDPFGFGDRYAEKTEKKYVDADFGTAGRLAGDVAQGVGGLLPSIASNIVAPGSGMVVMTSGAFGNATQEAKKNGADDATAMAYGLAVGAVEALTEKMYGGMGGVFGKGPVDDLVKNAINSHIKNGAARAGLNTLVSMFGEGLEEFVAEYGQLLADKLTIKKDERGFFSGETLSDAGRSALIGGIIGGLLNISDSIQAGKTPKEATQEAVEKVAESISEKESTAEPQTPAKTAKERVREKAEAAKAKETEEEIPRMELKGIEEETESDTQAAVQSAPAAKPAPTGTATERQRMQARAIGDMVEAGAAAKTSPAALGIENGGDIESITVLEEPLAKMFDFSEASEIAERAGYEPVYFSGMLQNANGGTSRWGIAGNKLYIQADSANYTAADIAKEAVERSTTNETIPDRGRDERYAGLSAGGQTERVSQQGGSQARRAAARANKAASYAAERASDYISTGSSEQTLKIIPAADYDGELKGIDKTLRKMGAKKVYFTVGSIGIVNPATGESASVSGVYDSDSGVMMVRADSEIYTAQQLAMHEAFHYIADADPTIREDAYNQLLAEMSEGEIEELAARYQVAYGNIYGDNVDAYVDEILADAYAGINRENLGADRYRSTVNSAVMAAARPETEQRQTNGPNENEQYSIETLADGKKYVRADRQVIFGNDPESWSEQLEDYINGKIRRGQNVVLTAEDGDLLTLTADTAGKVASMFNSDGTTLRSNVYERKVNAGSHIDELVITSKRGKDNVADYDAKHGSKADKGWNYRRAFFLDFDNKYYLCTISVMTGRDGNAVYNIGKMQERSFPNVSGSSAKNGAQNGKTSFDDNVAENEQDVKQRFSIEEDSEQKEINDTLEKLSDEARQQAREAVLAEREAARQQAALKPAATADEVVERKIAEAKAEAAEENAPELLAEKMSNSRGEFTGSAALEKLGIKVVNSIGKYNNVKQLLGNARAGRSIARERKKAEIRLKVTAKEKNFARGIANGIYTESDIPEGWDKRTVMEMSEWYMAERNFGESYIDLLKQAITVDVDAATAQMFEGADESKVPPAIVLNHRTAQRNMLNIFGDKGKEINKWLFDPVNQNEAERIRFINRQFDQVRTFEGQTGKQRALNKAEREMVQRVIEGRVVEDALAKLENRKDIETAADSLRKGEDIGDIGLEFGLTLEEQEIVESLVKWQDVQDQLEAMDKVIIYNAVDKYSALFDSYYEAINDFLAAHGYQPIGFIKGYVPHLQPEENQTALQNVFQKLGLNTDVSSLPTSIAGLTGDYKPNKKWNPYFLHRNSTVTQFDIVEAFESYVSNMADVLYHADDIMRIRSAVKYFRRTYSPEEIRNSIEWAENLRTMPKDEKISFLYDEGIITSGAGLSHADAKDMLNKYIEEQYGKIENTSKFNNLVTYLENYANILAGKQSIADRGSEYSLGRKILNAGNRLTRIFSRANVAGNFSSALNQSAQLPTILTENGLRNTTAAFKDIITGNLRKAGWAEDSDFLTGKRGVSFIVTTPGEMVIDAFFKPLEIVDSLMSTMAVRGAYLDGIKQGMSHEAAMQYADKKAAAIMGDRTKGAKPLAFEAKNPISSMVHLFQIEALNSWDHIASDLPRDIKTIAAVQGRKVAAKAFAGVLSKMLVYSFVLNRLAEKLYGGTPAPFDIFGLTANFIASGQELSTNAYLEALIDKVMLELFGMELFGSDEDERMQLSDGEFEWEAAAEDLGYNVSNELPFLNNLSALLGLGDKTLPVPDVITPLEGVYEGIKNKSVTEALDSALQLVGEIAPAGRQIVKTYTGAKMIAQGGKMKGFGEDARLQYPVRRTAGNITQALLFGASGLQENQDFYASGRTALTTKETALWKTLIANGADEEDAYDAIYSTKGEDIKTYEKLLMMSAPLDWNNGLKYDAMAGVTSDSFGYKLSVLENNDIDASEYAEVTAEMYDIAAARIAKLPEDDRPETVTISQEDAEKALKAANLSKQEKAIIWQMTNAGWSEKSNPFSKSIGKRVKAEYKKIKEQAEEEKKKEEEEDEIPRMQLRGLD